jgi:hypothetical protein
MEEPATTPANSRPIAISEPRGITILDLLAFIAGFAIALTPFASQNAAPGPIDFPLLTVLVMSVWLPWTAEIVVALDALERQFAYRRPLHPAEWMAILIALVGATFWIPPMEMWGVMLLSPILQPSDYRVIRWILAAIAVFVLFAGSGALAMFRARLPIWTITLLLAPLVLLWFCVPVDVVERLFPQRTLGADAPGPRWLSWAYVELHNIVTSLPRWVPFGIATVALWQERCTRSRRWIWTQWLACIAATLFGLFFLVVLYGSFSGPVQEEQIVLRIVMPFWILAVLGVSWCILQAGRAIHAKWTPSSEVKLP